MSFPLCLHSPPCLHHPFLLVNFLATLLLSLWNCCVHPLRIYTDAWQRDCFSFFGFPISSPSRQPLRNLGDYLFLTFHTIRSSLGMLHLTERRCSYLKRTLLLGSWTPIPFSPSFPSVFLIDWLWIDTSLHFPFSKHQIKNKRNFLEMEKKVKCEWNCLYFLNHKMNLFKCSIWKQCKIAILILKNKFIFNQSLNSTTGVVCVCGFCCCFFGLFCFYLETCG